MYDLADWITRLERHGAGIAELATDSPVDGRGAYTQRVTTKLGPIPLIYQAELRREGPMAEE
jgi:hypothetical protein